MLSLHFIIGQWHKEVVVRSLLYSTRAHNDMIVGCVWLVVMSTMTVSVTAFSNLGSLSEGTFDGISNLIIQFSSWDSTYFEIQIIQCNKMDVHNVQ